jgi:hypothetical protein
MGNCVARPSSRGDVVLVAPARATSLARDADADARAGRSAKKKRETIPLSPIDNALGVRTLVVHWAFMYRGRLPAARVKAALADALDSYPILAGRARKTRASRGRVALELEVVLDDAGVLFETATDDALGLDDLRGTENAGVVQGRDNETPPTFFARVDSRPERGNPLMSVRLTTLGDERRGGGCVLGVSWSHAVADGGVAAAAERLRRAGDGVHATRPGDPGLRRGDGGAVAAAEPGASSVVHGAVARQTRGAEVRSIHWFPYDRVGVVNADP